MTQLSFTRLFNNLAARHSENIALINIERDRSYSYREFHLLTNRIANMMHEKLGLGPGDAYFCILENDNISLLHIWTALKCRAAAAFTNLRDSSKDHWAQIELLKPRVIFIENFLLEGYADAMRQRGICVVCMDRPESRFEGVQYFWDLLEGVSEENPDTEYESHRDTVSFRFTSGTTGASKCVPYTADNWLSMRDSAYIGSEQLFDDRTRFLHIAPLSHGSGLTLLPTLFRGGCTITQNSPDLVTLCRNIEKYRVTATSLVPTMIYRLLEVPEVKDYDLSTLQTLIYGAAPMSPSRLREAQARFGNIFVQVYGSSECLNYIGVLSKADHLSATDKQIGSAGRVSPASEVMIVDDNGRELPAGEIGELWIRSRGTVSGYFKNPEASAAEFSGGFWKSGDLCYVCQEGFLYIVDRKKDMIISGGFNIYAAAVEDVLSSHPCVSHSAVVGIPHDEWGEAVHAEVVLKTNSQVDPADLIRHVKDQLGSYKAPKTITFVDELPIGATGKVMRRQVREKYWRGRQRFVS